MQAVNQTKEAPSNKSDVFDQLDSMPDISLKQLYYALKASRRRLKQKYGSENVESKLTDI